MKCNFTQPKHLTLIYTNNPYEVKFKTEVMNIETLVFRDTKAKHKHFAVAITTYHILFPEE